MARTEGAIDRDSTDEEEEQQWSPHHVVRRGGGAENGHALSRVLNTPTPRGLRAGSVASVKASAERATDPSVGSSRDRSCSLDGKP